jgi:hypothetical protein
MEKEKVGVLHVAEVNYANTVNRTANVLDVAILMDII